MKTAKHSKKVVRPLDVHCQEPPRKKRFAEARHRAEQAEALQAALKRNLEHKVSLLTRSATEPAPSRMEQLQKRVRLRLNARSLEQA